MFFVVRSNNSFNFPLGLIKYIVIVNTHTEASAHMSILITQSLIDTSFTDIKYLYIRLSTKIL